MPVFSAFLILNDFYPFTSCTLNNYRTQNKGAVLNIYFNKTSLLEINTFRHHPGKRPFGRSILRLQDNAENEIVNLNLGKE